MIWWLIAFLAAVVLAGCDNPYGEDETPISQTALATATSVSTPNTPPAAVVSQPTPIVVSSALAATVVSTPMPVTVVYGGCPPAEQLGPWAPSANFLGETFEVTAARNLLHLAVWWPHGNTPWRAQSQLKEPDRKPGSEEVSVEVTRGLSIEVINGAGTAWDYPEECSVDEIRRQISVYRQNRPMWTDFRGSATVEELVAAGLVRIRKDNRAAFVKPTAVSTVQAQRTSVQSAASCPDPVLVAHNPVAGQLWSPSGDWRIVNFWTNEPGKDQKGRKLLLSPGDNPALLGGGAVWNWSTACEDIARRNYNSNSLSPVTLEQLRSEGLAVAR